MREDERAALQQPLLQAQQPPGGEDAGSERSEAAADLDSKLAAAEAAHRRAVYRQMWGLALYALSTVFGTAMSLMAKLAGEPG